ncbi:uncharacterized protein LOC141644179 [Silene latifolia]|uniref:uncharacterized protein LOC141644179 n=1 Tax=Silene latifolia TaxID=37657 RepID=UPI003D783C34
MALQAGMGLSRLVFIVGAGYTGTILIKNNKLSEIIGELQNLVKGLESSGDSANADADPIAAQVRWLAQEVRQLANGRQITVLNGSSSQTDLSSLILPAATLGALGYGYMWWNGLSISDLMYVTKHSMTIAVDSLQQSLQFVAETIEKTKKQLLQRVQNLHVKIDEQREMSKEIRNMVGDMHEDCVEFHCKLNYLKEVVEKLDDNMIEFSRQQSLTNMGVAYLVNFVEGRSTEAPALTQIAQEVKSASAGRSRGLLPSENLGLQALLSITEGKFDDAQQPKNFMRSTSALAAKV